MKKTIEIRRPKKTTVIIDGEMITIKRFGMVQKLKGDKSIPLNSIASVQFRKAKLGVNGMLRFSLLGNNGFHGALADDNSILFVTKYNDEICEIKKYIEQYLINKSGSITNDYSELKKLKELLDLDIISPEEFELKKKKTLGL